jgi:hypothetical protein
MLEQLASTIANLPLIYFLAFSLIVILVDVLVLSNLFLFSIAFASLLSGLWNFLSFNSTLQLWLIPFNIAIGLAVQVFLVKRINFEKLPSERLHDIVGQNGTIFIVENSNLSSQYFYKYKENTSQESAPIEEKEIIKKVRLKDGSTYPISNDRALLKSNDGDIVKITGFNGYSVLINPQQED